MGRIKSCDQKGLRVRPALSPPPPPRRGCSPCAAAAGVSRLFRRRARARGVPAGAVRIVRAACAARSTLNAECVLRLPSHAPAVRCARSDEAEGLWRWRYEGQEEMFMDIDEEVRIRVKSLRFPERPASAEALALLLPLEGGMASADGIAFAPMVVEVRPFGRASPRRTSTHELAALPAAVRVLRRAPAGRDQQRWRTRHGAAVVVDVAPRGAKRKAMRGDVPSRSFIRASAREPLPRRVSCDGMCLRTAPVRGICARSLAPSPSPAGSQTTCTRPSGTVPDRRDAAPRAARAAAASARCGRTRIHTWVRGCPRAGCCHRPMVPAGNRGARGAARAQRAAQLPRLPLAACVRAA